MEPLEVVLRRTEDLKRNLTAEVVIQEEKSHTELVEKASLAGNIWDEWTENETIIDQPRIVKPDTPKREIARTQLQQIYDSSEWYSARYTAGSLIGEDVARNVKNWCVDFEKRLGATKIEEDKNYRPYDVQSNTENPNQNSRIIVIDVETRRNALADAIQLLKISNLPEIQELLKNEYLNNTSDYVRVKSGKALNYSDLRIWAHECIKGIVALAVGDFYD